MSSAGAHTPKDPNFLQPDIQKEWLTLRSPHFNFHYEAANRAAAVQMERVAERVYDRLTKWLEWAPAEPTEVVILDSVDASNGMATPVPYNRFQIYMPSPISGRLMDHNPWLDMVFTHEYIHILQLDMVHGAPEKVREIFGRLGGLFTPFVFPQLFAPSWVAEGLAVFGESDNSEGFGRLNSAWYAAVMRLEVERGVRSLTEMSFEGYGGVRWPYGQIYIYGAYFMQFIEARYGRDAIRRYFMVYSSNLIPWRMDSRSRTVFGKSAEVVWQEFQAYLKQQFEPQLAALRMQQSGKGALLFDAPYNTRLLTAGSSGELYFYHDDAQSRPVVRRLDADGGSRELFAIQNLIHMDWHAQSGLLLNREAVCDNTNLYTDLYLWLPGDRKPKRLTECGRYRLSAWRPDGEAIAALQLERGNSLLVLLDRTGEVVEVLSEFPVGDVLGKFAWSPDGRLIVAAVKRLTSGWNIELFDLANRQWRPLTRNADIESQPRFSVDGRRINFLSDHDGVWDLRQLQLGSGEIATLSHSDSAVMEAVEIADQRFRIAEYRSNGIEISELLPAVNEARYPATSEQLFSVPVAASSPSPDMLQEQPYEPLHSMRPRSWFPLSEINSDETSFAGIVVMGEDVLGFHRWNVMPLYYYDQQRLGGLAYYSFDDRLTLSIQRQFMRGSGNDFDAYVEDERRLQLLFNHWINGLDRSFSIAVGLAAEESDIEVVQGSGRYESIDDTLAGIVLGYDTADYYRRSISLSDGRHFSLTLESYDLAGQSDHSGETYRIDWDEFLRLGGGQVLKLKAMFAEGDSGIAPYELGGETELLSQLGGLTGLGSRHFPLRGFAAGNSEMVGTNMAIFSAEWRYPLGYHYDGWFVPPVGLGRHSITLFADSGDAWSDGGSMRLNSGVGVEWAGELLFGYNMIHIGATVGMAHGFGSLGEDRIYLKIGLPL
ncbi:MAG: hypothetical protein L3J28_01850 [Candidatus Polarisedimenticolaceae bacterium]|nr:hypothetical protein [Candidatus Polarisedimenticolaceae bacterium]